MLWYRRRGVSGCDVVDTWWWGSKWWGQAEEGTWEVEKRHFFWRMSFALRKERRGKEGCCVCVSVSLCGFGCHTFSPLLAYTVVIAAAQSNYLLYGSK